MPRILIVDDEPNIVLALEMLMKREGFETRTVADGARAVEAAEAFRPDLILLDVMMPRMDGFEVCQRIRADASLKHFHHHVDREGPRGREGEGAGPRGGPLHHRFSTRRSSKGQELLESKPG
jgi:CheY-like chemotaxis protein